MRVLHVISDISRASGGPSRSAQGLVAGLNAAGFEAWLMALHRGDQPWVDGVTRFVNASPFENILLQVRPQIVHMHGIWDFSLHRCVVVCRRCDIPYVIAPRGMLEPWSLQQKWLKKRLARWLYQDVDLKYAAALHATAESEAEQFRRLGFKNPVIVSPNGVNVPKSFERIAHQNKHILFVSRMHPKKGVLELVEAYSACSKRSIRLKDWLVELVYTTNSGLELEYEAKVKSRVHELGLDDKFIFTGALDDVAKWQAYASADLFVLPTYSENFGIVVAEALWAGLPVITTKGTPWCDLESAKCGKWIDVGIEPLAEALKEMIMMPDEERKHMGDRGRNLVEDKYTWRAVIKAVVKGYERVLDV